MQLPPLKDYQRRGIEAMQAARARKTGPVLGVAPPGAGKSRCMFELANAEVAAGGRVVIKAHRRMLVDQLVTTFQNSGMEFGVLSPEHEPNESAPVQIVSSQTLFSRAVIKGSIPFPEASLVINDEAHQQASMMERAMLFGSFTGSTVQEGFLGRGADIVGFTATPIMESAIYSTLIDFGTYKELRKAKMHLPIRTYSPSEIDTAGLSRTISGDFSEKGLEERVMKIYGDVFSEYRKLNHKKRPAILFAPSVASSRWFALSFHDAGIPVAHIDGESCLISEGGQLNPYASTREVRDRILAMSKSGEIKIVCNRFVLREAIDMPWLYHAIFATVMGSLTTYLQSVGRLQRYWEGYTEKILQCHGGSFWRHGSPNEDRTWKLGTTSKEALKERIEKIQHGEISEGICCPMCSAWRKGGPVCVNPQCGHSHTMSIRAVRTVSGRLKKIKGPIYQKPSEYNPAKAAEAIWTQQIYIGAAMNMTVGQCVKIFRDRCNAAGIPRVDTAGFRTPLPHATSPQWDLRVPDVHPWAVRKAKAT